jgi:GNAT superfamily N-acetyltransferase
MIPLFLVNVLTVGLELFTLVVSPNYQRRGIGSLLFKDFVHEADEAGLQAILGASPVGIGLYRKYGFVDFRVMNFKLWEYDGGKGMGIARHVIMHRPAVTKGSSK